MKQQKFMNIMLAVFLTAALLFSSSFAQEEADIEEEPAETGTLVVNANRMAGRAEYIYVLDEEAPGIDVSADGISVSADVEGGTYAVSGGVNVVTSNGGNAELHLGSVRGGYGFWSYLYTGSVTADIESITSAGDTGIDIMTNGAAALTLTAGDVSSASHGVAVQTGIEPETYDYDRDFFPPEEPGDEDWDSEKWDDVDGVLSAESSSGYTAGTATGGANVTITVSGIDAVDTAADIEVNQNDTVTLTAEDYIQSGTNGALVTLNGEGGSATLTAPLISADERGLVVYAADGSVQATVEEYISASSAVELTNDGADETLSAGYLEGNSGLYIEATDGTTTAETKDITADNYGVYVWTYTPDVYKEYDPNNTESQPETGTEQESQSGSPTVKVTVNGDITDYIDYQPVDYVDIIDPIIGDDVVNQVSKATAAEDDENSTEASSTGIIVEAETQSQINIIVNGAIEMSYGNEAEALDGSTVNVSVSDDVTTDYGNRIASYDGSKVTFDFGGDIYAGGKALDTDVDSGTLTVTVKGENGITVQDGNADEETAGIYATSAGTGDTNISIENGGVDVKSENGNGTYGISLANYGGIINVKSASDVTAEGADSTGLEIINDPESEEVSVQTNVEINGSVSGSGSGLDFYSVEDADNAKAAVLVTDTISGGVVLENAASDNLDLAVWKIDTSATGGNAAVTPDNQPSEFASEIKYLIKINPKDADKIQAVDENGNPLPTVNGPVTGTAYPYAKEGEKVYLKGINGYELTEAYNGTETQTPLALDDGRFSWQIRPGGAVWFSVTKNPAPIPPTPYQDLEWLCGLELPHTGFSASRITQLAARPQGLAYRNTGLTLQIPGLDVAEQIVTVPESEDGSYPVEWLGSEIGLLEQSALPGKGVTVLTGHNHLNTTEAGPFLFLSRLEEGDHIMVNDRFNRMQMYRVYSNVKISSDSFETVADNVRADALVLITCEDESVDGGYLNRRVILAEPM
ncbi:MAG: sortase [Anaerolineaceae bacterium]|nr:sortase [Anaerolineaceae bacterium]